MIIKNNDDILNTAVTIKRCPKDTLVAVGTRNVYFRLYEQLNNKYFTMPWYNALGESVIIRCEIEANAEGYLYGNTSGANIYIYKSGSTHNIQWRNGSTVLKSVALDDKEHRIGWMGSIPDAASFSGRKMSPYIDGVTDTSIEVTTTVSPVKARVGGNTGGDCIHSTGTWAIRIYEVYANSFYFDTLTTACWEFKMFPVTYYVDSTDAIFIDTRSCLETAPGHNGNAVSGVTISSSAQNFTTEQMGYGVELHDVKYVTGSGYNDLVNLLAEDGGVDGEAGFEADGTAAGQADYPASLTQSTDVRKYAVSVKDIPRPSGWTYAEFNPSISGGYNYAGFELHHGRKPKWSIWNDVIDFGFLVDSNGYMNFDIHKRMVGTGYDGGPAFCRTKTLGSPLQYFNGYNTHPDNFHAPYVRFTDKTLAVNIHNGAMLRTQSDDVCGGSLNSFTYLSRPPKDNEVIYSLNESLGGQVSYRLGNLAPWNRTYDEMQDIGWIPMGAKLSLTLTEQGSDTFVETKEHKQTSAPYLTSGATDTVKNEYRINGWTEDLVVTSDPERKWLLLDHIMNYTESNPMPLWAKMSMITGVAAINNVIDCSRLVASKKCSMYPIYEPKNDGTTGVNERDTNWNSTDATYRAGWADLDAPNYRMIMAPEGNINICNVYGCYFSNAFDNETYSPLMKTRFDWIDGVGDNIKIFTSFVVPFIGCTTDANGKITALDNANTDYMGLVELFYYDNGSYKYFATVKKAMTKSQLEYQIQYPNPDYDPWYGPFTASYWVGNNPTSPYALWKNGIRQFGYYTNGSGGSDIKYTTEDCAGINAHNDQSGYLYDKVRFLAVNGKKDFTFSRQPNNFALPKDSTVICHIFKINTASKSPVLVAFDSAMWDANHHHLIYPDKGTPTTSQRTYEMADSWLQPSLNNDNDSVTINLYFRSFTRSGSNYVVANPVMMPRPAYDSGSVTIKRYNAAGTLQSTTTDYCYNLLDKDSGNNANLYDKKILGLDGVIYDKCYLMKKTFTGINAGDYFIVSIS